MMSLDGIPLALESIIRNVYRRPMLTAFKKALCTPASRHDG
jgi:hypothetical protein